MAEKVGSVYIEIQAKMGTLEKDLKTLETRMAGADQKAQQVSSSFMSMGKIIGGSLITGAIIGIGKAALKASAEMEQNRVAFTTMLGSATKAKDLLAEMTAFAANTPFELPEIVDGGKKLLAFGFAAKDIIPTLTKLGDVSAALSIPIGELSDIYGKMKVQGVIQAEELNQLAGRGIPVFTELAKVMGVNADQVKKLGSEGKISFKELEQAFTNMTDKGSQFGGMMEAQSKTLAGQWSNFQDTLGKIAVIIGDEIAPAAKTWLELLGNISNAVINQESDTSAISSAMRKIAIPAKALWDYATWTAGAINEQVTRLESVNAKSREVNNVTKEIADSAKVYSQNLYNSAIPLEQNTQKMMEFVKSADEAGKSTAKAKPTPEAIAAWKKLRDEAKKYNEELSTKAIESNDPLVNMQREIDASTESYNKNKDLKKQGLIDTSQYNLNVLNITEARIKKEEELEKAKFDKNIANASAVLNVAGGLASQLSNLANMSASNQTARIDNELTAQQEALNAQYEADVAAVNAEVITQEEKDAKLKALDEKKARDSKALEDAAAKEKRKIARENAKIQKQLAIFQVMITTPQAAMAAYSSLVGIPFVGPVLAGIAAAATVALGVKQIQLIQEQPLPALAEGGIVPSVPGGNKYTLGEGGSREAVIPLDNRGKDVLKDAMGGGLPTQITLMVDGETFGKWIYNTTKNGQTIYSKNGMVA